MPEYHLQRLRGGWAIVLTEGGKRLSRRKLQAVSAAEAAAAFQAAVAELTKPVDPDVNTLWQAYREDRAGRRIAENMEWSGRAILPFFGGLKPTSVSTKGCRAYVMQRRLAGRKNGTIRTELNHLRIVLAWAEKTGLIAKAPTLELPPRAAPKERHLTRAEFDRLLEASETPHLRLYLNLAIGTAGRNAALLELTWRQVDFARGLIYLGNALTMRSRKGRATVPMNDTLRAALSAVREGARTDYVIEWAGQPVRSVKTALKKAAKRAGLTGVSPHVLRHSAACWMAEDGRSMDEIATFLGHSDSAITSRVYARLSPTYLRSAAASLEIGTLRRVK